VSRSGFQEPKEAMIMPVERFSDDRFRLHRFERENIVATTPGNIVANNAQNGPVDKEETTVPVPASNRHLTPAANLE